MNKENIYQIRNPYSIMGGSKSEWESSIKIKFGKEVESKKGMCIEDKSYKNSGNFQNTWLNFSGLSKTAHDESENVPYMDGKLWKSSFIWKWNRIKSYFLAKVMP